MPDSVGRQWFSPFGTAFAVGTQARSFTTDAFTFATAVGDRATARAYGLFGIAASLGPNGNTRTSGSASFGNLGFIIAVNVTPGTTVPVGSQVVAEGVGNVAVNLFGKGTTVGGHTVAAFGIFNHAMALGGSNNKVVAVGDSLNHAFSIVGSNNIVIAGSGPVAIAGSIRQTGTIVKKVGPGFNINNGLIVGGAAAVGNTNPATALRTTNTPTRSAAGVGTSNTGKKNAAHSAAAHSTGSSKR